MVEDDHSSTPSRSGPPACCTARRRAAGSEAPRELLTPPARRHGTSCQNTGLSPSCTGIPGGETLPTPAWVPCASCAVNLLPCYRDRGEHTCGSKCLGRPFLHGVCTQQLSGTRSLPAHCCGPSSYLFSSSSLAASSWVRVARMLASSRLSGCHPGCDFHVGLAS